MVSVGVASFGHLDGVHYQNEKDFGPYVGRISQNELPVRRASTAPNPGHGVTVSVAEGGASSCRIENRVTPATSLAGPRTTGPGAGPNAGAAVSVNAA